jgi:hypothetical protein
VGVLFSDDGSLRHQEEAVIERSLRPLAFESGVFSLLMVCLLTLNLHAYIYIFSPNCRFLTVFDTACSRNEWKNEVLAMELVM